MVLPSLSCQGCSKTTWVQKTGCVTAIVTWLMIMVVVAIGSGWAAVDNKNRQISVHISQRASLSLNHTLITFAGDGNKLAIQAIQGPVQFKAKERASESQSLPLTARVDSDLQVASASIPGSFVQWTTQGKSLRKAH